MPQDKREIKVSIPIIIGSDGDYMTRSVAMYHGNYTSSEWPQDAVTGGIPTALEAEGTRRMIVAIVPVPDPPLASLPDIEAQVD